MDTLYLWFLLNHGISNRSPIDLHIPHKEKDKIIFYDIRYQAKYMDKVSRQFKVSNSAFKPGIDNWVQLKIKTQFAFQTKWMIIYLNLTFPPTINDFGFPK